MITSGIRKLLFAGLLVTAGLLFTFGVVNQRAQPDQLRSVLSLQAPPFVNVARAAEASQTTFDLGAYLDQEADMSAYFHSDPINLDQVLPVFRTIEMTTTDFIIGSVQCGNYVEHFDVHVYVNTNGWILAYYLRDTPVSTIVSTSPWSIDTSKLTCAIAKVVQAAGGGFTDSNASYYDFHYPNATRMMFTYEDSANGNDFTIYLPCSYTYYERSYISWGYPYYGFTIDGVSPPRVYEQNYLKYGYVSSSELSCNIWHTITVGGNGVLVIIYRES